MTLHHEAVTHTVHHDAVYETVHHDAVYEGIVVCNGCGAVFTADEYEAGREHAYQHALRGEYSNTHNSYRLISDAYDEQVLASAAYDETVVTGYRCSKCGAGK